MAQDTSSSQPPLLPSLYALLPPSAHLALLSQLSLLALHCSTTHQTDTHFVSLKPVQAGQVRTLRLRTTRSNGSKSAGETLDNGPGKSKGKARETFELAYISNALSGREYREFDVRATVAMDIQGLSGQEEVEEFVKMLGCQKTHSYSRSGLTFHIPIPVSTPVPLTLLVSITKLGSASLEAGPGDPFLVQLCPSRPIMAVGSGTGDVSVLGMMDIMREVAGRIDTLEWGTGRPP